ncbi:MAG: 16S rRNA (adenine(1518)-N(6)/adenine(1519)-N(6))-dimethyltransferase RsmA [Halanaerobiaceae bacterium]
MEKNIATPGVTKELLKKYNINLKKKLGQNLLIDANILNKMIEGADLSTEDKVIEIGPGIGSLTEKILEVVKKGKVFAIEKDKRFIKILKDVFKNRNNLILINNDIRDIDWEIFFNKRNIKPENIKIMGNLPYYISTPIIRMLLEKEFTFSKLTFMVQKEVAQRMVATPGTKEYGLLSIAVQFYAKSEIIHQVPPTVFLPQPEVCSSIIALSPFFKSPFEVNDINFFFKVVKAIFQLRRKNIKNSLVKGSIMDLNKETVIKGLKKSGIDPRSRGENLSIEKIVYFSNNLYNLNKERSD